MSSSNSEPVELLQETVLAFRDQFDSVLLATAAPDGTPSASYAPHLVNSDGSIWIFVSELAAHTQNLKQNPRASLLFIQNEQDTKNLFARQRLSLRCSVEEIPRSSEAADDILSAMQDKHGQMLELLRTLPDFHLFRFDIKSGDYVAGFGKAFRISGNELLVNPEPRKV